MQIELDGVDAVSLAIVILAAGDAGGNGLWCNSKRPKVLHEVGGKSLLEHVIRAASGVVPAADIYVAVSEQADRIEAALTSAGVGFVRDVARRETGHPIEIVKDAIARHDEILVLPGDLPLLTSGSLKHLLEYHRLGYAMSVLTVLVEAASSQGNVIRLASGDEKKGLDIAEILPRHSWGGPREVDSGVYAFQTAHLLAHLPESTRKHGSGGECCLADLAKILVKDGERVCAVQGPADEVRGAETIAELVELDAALRARTAQRLMAAGVTILRPETCLFDIDVEVAADTVIEPGVQLLGRTKIGADCRIRTGTVIEDSTIGNDVLIRQSCVITESTVEDGAKIGPFAHLRPGSVIGEEAHLGNFVETKKVRLGKGAKVGHLTYLGDAEVGADTNIGAGVITCNFDGVNKHKTVIGAGAFVGSDSTLVAPISIGDGAYIGAGSCITRDVPLDALAVGRSRQITKEGWAKQKRAKLRGES